MDNEQKKTNSPRPDAWVPLGMGLGTGLGLLMTWVFQVNALLMVGVLLGTVGGAVFGVWRARQTKD